MTPAATASDQSVVQLVVFRLGDRECALPVERISEVLRMVAIAAVPEAPHWIPGVINLRGRVIPVIDLRLRLGLPASDIALNTPIIVAEHDGEMVGLIADAVVELLSLPTSSVESPASNGGADPAASALQAIARADDRLILIFDIGQLCAGSLNGAWAGR